VLGRDEKYLDRVSSSQSVIQELMQREAEVDRVIEKDTESEIQLDHISINSVQSESKKGIDQNQADEETLPEIENLIETHHSVFIFWY
jgi:hypothetical protein